MITVRKKLTVRELEERFSKHGWELLEKESLGVGYKYRAKCPCGNIRNKSPHSFKDGVRCMSCVNKEKAESKRLSWKEVVKLFKEKGIELKSNNEYKNTKTPLSCVCPCGRDAKMSVDHVRKGGLCKGCAYERNGRRKYTAKEIDELLSKEGITLITRGEGRLRNSVDYVCECGRIGRSTLSNLIKGVRCRECINENNSGSNNHNYDPTLTKEDRENRRVDIISMDWPRKIKERDKYKCQVCGINRNVVAHHIFSYKENEELRTNLNNGVTLCEGCHIDFHKHYGYGENDLDQFLTYLMWRWERGNENTFIRH